MLAYAKPYEDQVKKLFTDVTFDMFYKYASLTVYREEWKIPDSTWEGHQFVSMAEDQIIGYIAYYIDRITNAVSGLHLMHFEKKHKCEFGRDVMTALRDIFEKFHFQKISFSVVVGNPIEKCYDRLAKRAGGRIVGIKKQEVRLIDNHLYDLKLYEVLLEDYLGISGKYSLFDKRNKRWAGGGFDTVRRAIDFAQNVGLSDFAVYPYGAVLAGVDEVYDSSEKEYTPNDLPKNGFVDVQINPDAIKDIQDTADTLVRAGEMTVVNAIK